MAHETWRTCTNISYLLIAIIDTIDFVGAILYSILLKFIINYSMHIAYAE